MNTILILLLVVLAFLYGRSIVRSPKNLPSSILSSPGGVARAYCARLEKAGRLNPNCYEDALFRISREGKSAIDSFKSIIACRSSNLMDCAESL